MPFIQSRNQMVELPGVESDSEVEIDAAELEYQRLKVRIHEKLVDSLDLSLLAHVSESELSGEVQVLAKELIAEEVPKTNMALRERLQTEMSDEVFGLGPLETLLKDDTISDILVNSTSEVFIERRGRLEPSGVVFADEKHLMRIIQRIVSRVGRRIDEVSPMVDARLPDGSRVNAVIPPLALNGPTLSIRRFGKHPLQIEDGSFGHPGRSLRGMFFCHR